jgi:hypothetical protein
VGPRPGPVPPERHAELAARRRIRSLAAVVLAVQAALIATFMLYGRMLLVGRQVAGRSLAGFYALAGLAVVSMGMQTAALRQARRAHHQHDVRHGRPHLARAGGRQLGLLAPRWRPTRRAAQPPQQRASLPTNDEPLAG